MKQSRDKAFKVAVIDDFLDDPDKARQLAYTEGDFENCPDKTEQIYNDLATKELRDTEAQTKVFEDILGEEILMAGNKFRKFNICMEMPDGQVHVHHDSCDYLGFVHLQDPQTPEDGTYLVRHKETGVNYYRPDLFGSEMVQDAVEGSDNLDLSKWEIDLFIPMKKNRLVIIEPLHYHTESRTFGKIAETARCVEIFHMFKKSRLDHWLRELKEEITSGEYELYGDLL